jgi:hypothetical protein
MAAWIDKFERNDWLNLAIIMKQCLTDLVKDSLIQ